MSTGLYIFEMLAGIALIIYGVGMLLNKRRARRAGQGGKASPEGQK